MSNPLSDLAHKLKKGANKVGNKVVDAATSAEHEASHVADSVANKTEHAFNEVSQIADKAFDEIKSKIEHLGKDVENDIDHLAIDAKKEINQVANQAKKEIIKDLNHLIGDLEHALRMFGEAVANGLIEKALNIALHKATRYNVIPDPITIGFEFWDIGFGVVISDIENRIPKIEHYAHNPPHRARDIGDMVLALVPDSLLVNVLGNKVNFNAEQIEHVIIDVLGDFGIK